MILALLLEESLEPKLVASTNGGEYASPCPLCGGTDRFRSWPAKDRWYCRGCNKSGDIVEYFHHIRGMSYPEAFRAAGREPSCPLTRQSFSRLGPGKPGWQAKKVTFPSASWQEKALAFVTWSHDQLLNRAESLDWLRLNRGLSVETVRAFRLGWNPKDRYRPRGSWGLPDALNSDGRAKRLWLPEGLVIPVFLESQLARVKIRRQNPGNGPRYVAIGSDGAGSTTPLVCGPERQSLVIVESELDAILIAQESADFVGVIAIGSASYRPDTAIDGLLNRNRGQILLALDADRAGGSAAWGFWFENYQVFRWPPIGGKDPGEMKLSGTPIREWLIAGIEAMREKKV